MKKWTSISQTFFRFWDHFGSPNGTQKSPKIVKKRLWTVLLVIFGRFGCPDCPGTRFLSISGRFLLVSGSIFNRNLRNSCPANSNPQRRKPMQVRRSREANSIRRTSSEVAGVIQSNFRFLSKTGVFKLPPPRRLGKSAIDLKEDSLILTVSLRKNVVSTMPNVVSTMPRGVWGVRPSGDKR